jgi:tRNA nucleotidyltransferase (CCA-adding enzyme)
VNGTDLLAIGFSSDQNLGRCLKEIRDRGLNGEIRDYAGALDFAKTYLEEMKLS